MSKRELEQELNEINQKLVVRYLAISYLSNKIAKNLILEMKNKNQVEKDDK